MSEPEARINYEATLTDIDADGVCHFSDGAKYRLPAWLDVARAAVGPDGVPGWTFTLRASGDGQRRGVAVAGGATTWGQVDMALGLLWREQQKIQPPRGEVLQGSP